MLAKRAARDGVIVLRGHRENDPALAQGQCSLLHAQVGFAGWIAVAQHDASQAVIADDASPQGVVQVEDEALARLAAHRTDKAACPVAIEGHQVMREEKFPERPLHGIVPAGQADRFCK